MINDQQIKRINEGAQRVVVDTLESYKMGWDRLAEANEDQTRFAKNLSEGTMRNLRTQAERNMEAAEELTEHAREGQEAGRVLGRAQLSGLGFCARRVVESHSRDRPRGCPQARPRARSNRRWA